MSVPFYHNQAVRPPQPPFIPPQQQQLPFRNQFMMDPNRRRSHNKIIRPDGSIEEVEEADDDISARDIATARYKRNHDYLNEIFTSHTTKDTTMINTPIEQSKEELDQLSEKYNKSIQEERQKHIDKIKQIEQEDQQFWELMNKLNDANTLETMESVSDEFTKSMGLKIQYSPLKVNEISIPEAMDL